MPEKAREMNQRLTEMNATYPFYNPHCKAELPHKENVPVVVSHEQVGKTVKVTYKERGARVVKSSLIYTLEGKNPRAEWFSIPAGLLPDRQVEATLPEGTTHYFINLIDENTFLVSYPEFRNAKTPAKPNTTRKKRTRNNPTESALQVK